MEKAYYMSIVDIFTHYTWIYFLNWKSDVVKNFLQFYKHAKKQLSIVLKYVPIDGGGEFKALTPYFTQHGIEHRITFPYTSNQNGILKIKHRQIVEMGLTFASSFYSYAVLEWFFQHNYFSN